LQTASQFGLDAVTLTGTTVQDEVCLDTSGDTCELMYFFEISSSDTFTENFDGILGLAPVSTTDPVSFMGSSLA
jgi:hypothetical protein